MSLLNAANDELRSLEGHRRILGIIFVVLNVLMLLLAVAFGVFGLALGQMGMEHARADERAMMNIVVAGITGCFLLLSLPGLITGIGLLKRRSWARVMALVLGILGIANVPLGTALGIYTLWFYLQPGSDQVFE